MTQKLYEFEPKLVQYAAKISCRGEKDIKVLDVKNQPIIKRCGFIETQATIFHPQGGGQPADKGTINEIEILHVGLEKNNGVDKIYHYFELEKYSSEAEKLIVNDIVQMRVDAEFRQKCNRYHSAGHLLGDIIEHHAAFREISTLAKRGNHFPGQAFVVFEYETTFQLPLFLSDLHENNVLRETIQQLFDKCVADAQQTQIVEEKSSCSEGGSVARRVIVGDSGMPCGGTHVENTAELKGTIIGEIVREKTKSPALPAFKVKYSCH